MRVINCHDDENQKRGDEVFMVFWIIDGDTNLYESSCKVSKEYIQQCVDYNKYKCNQDPRHKILLHSTVQRVIHSPGYNDNIFYTILVSYLSCFQPQLQFENSPLNTECCVLIMDTVESNSRIHITDLESVGEMKKGIQIYQMNKCMN